MAQNDSHKLDLLNNLLDEARRRGATAADALFVQSRELGLRRRLGIIEHLERSESAGISLRLFAGKKQAMASSTDLSRKGLETLLTRTMEMTRAAPEDPFLGLAPETLLARDVPALDLHDAAEPEERWLLDQCEILEETALAEKGITNSEGAEASYSASDVSLAIAGEDGQRFARHYPGSYFSLSVSVVGGEGTGMERDYAFSSCRHRADLEKPEAIGREAATRTLRRLNPRRARSCEVPVVFDPRVGKSLLSSFAGAINGSTVARGTSFLKDRMDAQVFSKQLRIIDDPHRKRGIASKPFDGEGVANAKRALVEDGVLRSWLLDLHSAAKLKLATTGHASRGMSRPPTPASTNLYIEAGTATPQELIGSVKSGFYVTETFGMGINIVTGDYSQGASGFWIENGQLAYPVSELTIAGKLGDMFLHLQPADDLEFRYGTNTPTLLVHQMTVAGT